MTTSRARSIVIPLWARAVAYSAANRCTSSASCGEMIVASSMSSPSTDARARTFISSPSSVKRATPRRSRIEAASRIRSSVLSGSTMCLSAARARSISWYSNISGVRTSEADTSIAFINASLSTFSEKSRRATSSLRVEVLDIGPRTADSWAAVVKVPSSVDRMGRLCGMPSSSRRTCSGMG